jgi:hypothetical protein
MSALVGRNNNVLNPALEHEGPAVENEAEHLVSPCKLSKLEGWEISHATTFQSRNENKEGKLKSFSRGLLSEIGDEIGDD